MRDRMILAIFRSPRSTAYSRRTSMAQVTSRRTWSIGCAAGLVPRERCVAFAGQLRRSPRLRRLSAIQKTIGHCSTRPTTRTMRDQRRTMLGARAITLRWELLHGSPSPKGQMPMVISAPCGNHMASPRLHFLASKTVFSSRLSRIITASSHQRDQRHNEAQLERRL